MSTKTLVLRPRLENDQGIPGWHDAIAMTYAVERIATGKAVSKMALWFSVARKIEIGREETDRQINAEVEIMLRKGEIAALERELKKLPPEAFGKHPMTGQPATPPLAGLLEMLSDFEQQLEIDLGLDDSTAEDE